MVPSVLVADITGDLTVPFKVSDEASREIESTEHELVEESEVALVEMIVVGPPARVPSNVMLVLAKVRYESPVTLPEIVVVALVALTEEAQTVPFNARTDAERVRESVVALLVEKNEMVPDVVMLTVPPVIVPCTSASPLMDNASVLKVEAGENTAFPAVTLRVGALIDPDTVKYCDVTSEFVVAVIDPEMVVWLARTSERVDVCTPPNSSTLFP
jgi:hypothetical protein